MESSDKDHDQPRSTSGRENPLIAFRHFVDEQMASLLQGFIGLPSAFTSQPSASEWAKRAHESHQQALERWGNGQRSENWAGIRGNNLNKELFDKKSDDSDAELARYIEESFGTVFEQADNLQCPYRPTNPTPDPTQGLHQQNEPDAPTRCPYRPCEQDEPEALDSSNAYFHHPSLGTLIHGRWYSSGSWPLEYLCTSEYSPVFLEATEGLCEFGSVWRNAFEDLLDAEAGITMQPARLRDDGMDNCQWLKYAALGRLADTPAYRRQLPSLARELGSRQAENDEGEDTELDHYESFLASTQQGSARSLPLQSHQPEVPSSKEVEGLGIISTLTTSERTTLPDGTIHTKMTLKKRFADGREECNETVQTTLGSKLSRHTSDTGNISKEDSRPEKVEKGPSSERKEKKGWFWS